MKQKIYLILDNIRSRENVGSTFRTADAVGIFKIYLCGITPTPSAESSKSQIIKLKQTQNSKPEIKNNIDKISKTALGAEKWIPWEYRKQCWRCIMELKKQNSKIKIIGLEQTKKSKNIFKYSQSLSKNNNLALVVGNEVRGLSKKILNYCDEIVHIPMLGRKESLNVAVATGIALYQLRSFKIRRIN
jgi:tRNA G18 (ribose-2'-O)-methylase SpoU